MRKFAMLAAFATRFVVEREANPALEEVGVEAMCHLELSHFPLKKYAHSTTGRTPDNI